MAGIHRRQGERRRDGELDVAGDAEQSTAVDVEQVEGDRNRGDPLRLGDELAGQKSGWHYAIGPELDADGITLVRERIERPAEVEAFALWLRGRAIGAFLAFGRPREPLTELARQAAAAITAGHDSASETVRAIHSAVLRASGGRSRGRRDGPLPAGGMRSRARSWVSPSRRSWVS